VIFYKRLELGTFEMPQALHAADGVGGIEMRLSELTLILEGIVTVVESASLPGVVA
jgi:hypothetical protein